MYIHKHAITRPEDHQSYDFKTLADLGGGLRGLQPPLVGKFYQKKRSFFAIFRAATPPFPDRMVDNSSHERLQPPLSKNSRSAYVKSTDAQVLFLIFLIRCWNPERWRCWSISSSRSSSPVSTAPCPRGGITAALLPNGRDTKAWCLDFLWGENQVLSGYVRITMYRRLWLDVDDRDS